MEITLENKGGTPSACGKSKAHVDGMKTIGELSRFTLVSLGSNRETDMSMRGDCPSVTMLGLHGRWAPTEVAWEVATLDAQYLGSIYAW